MRLLFASLLMCLTISGAHAADPADLWRALEAADDQAMASYVEAHYRDAGASLDDGLTWDFRPFDLIVNYYDHDQVVIILAAMPKDAQIDAYWQNWSKALTQDRWKPAAFFTDPTEARLLARYNQFVLAAHEYGHALSYRYDIDHLMRHDYSVNCREFYADRLAASLISEVSLKSAALSALQSRYVELMASLNAQVADKDRYAIPSLAGLEADCGSIDVAQPDETSMAPYASAFFERQRLLLAAGPPPLSEIYEKFLFPRLEAKLPPPSGLAGPVETMAELHELVALPLGAERRHYLLSFAGFYLLDAGEGTLAYGPAEGPLEPVPMPEGAFRVFDGLSLGADHFLFLAAGQASDSGAVHLFFAQRTGAGWTIADKTVADNLYITRLAHDPTGVIHLFNMANEVPYVYTRAILDPATFVPSPAVEIPIDGDPIAVGAKGEIYSFFEGTILVTGPGDTMLTFAGHRLEGFKDNPDPLSAEFYDVAAALPTADGGLLVMDHNPRTGEATLRGIAPAAAR
jgi:hypothetical protein